MDICPNCHRKLLSHGSARCNWCGEMIPDLGYQIEAAEKREEFFDEQHAQDADSLQTIESIVDHRY